VFADLKSADKDGFRPILRSLTAERDNLSPVGGHINVCYGKEWYRYPSSFFLPSSDRYRMRFIRSDFRGQLPKLQENNPNLRGLPTRIIHTDFNDMNKEEITRYVRPEECHYLIDSSQKTTSENEPDYSKSIKDWKILSTHRMLDLHNSPIVIRSFYLPYISEKQNSYTEYRLLRNNNLFIQSEGERP